MSRLVPAMALALAAAPAALAQDVVFPLDEVGQDAATGAPRARLALDRAAVLLDAWDARLADAPLPDGTRGTLRVERLDPERNRFRFLVDGAVRPGLLDGTDLTLWSGHVEGRSDSEVALAFTPYGTRGWIAVGDRTLHLVPRPDANGDWTNGDVLLADSALLARLGREMDHTCRAEDVAAASRRTYPSGLPSGGSNRSRGTACELYECPIAIETDFQLYEVFGSDINVVTTYVTSLLTFVSARYEQQASTVLTFPYVQFYTTSSDPWTEVDSGGNCIDVLFEFQSAWIGNIPANARLGHMLSGGNLGCGVAWLDVLCNNTYNFSVSGNMGYLGPVSFPIVQQPFNWDFMVVAHELGHNFASPHTHDFCPTLDDCAPPGYFGTCQTQQNCANASRGTIMSYCHQCPGGTGNITTWFHPVVSDVITDGARNCLMPYTGIRTEAPAFAPPSTPTTISACVTGAAIGSPTLHWRNGGATFTSQAMSDLGGGNYEGVLPGAACGERIDYYVSYLDAGGFTRFSPSGAPAGYYTLQIEHPVPVLDDDFEADLGWTTGAIGATDGYWERDVPVNDVFLDFDPPADFDGSGKCYVTANRDGVSDVDDGAVVLESPSFDMLAGEGTRLRYAYWLELTDESGGDALTVEISENGAAGPWVEIARYTSDGGEEWRTDVVWDGDLVGMGITPTSDMRVRFVANDADPQSVVEAGVDAFAVEFDDCFGIGTYYCDAAANSTGDPGSIGASGSYVALDNELTLSAQDLPQNAFGYFLVSSTQAFVQNPGGSQGNLCLGGSVGRFVHQIQNSGSAGLFSIDVDLSNLPQPNGSVSVVAGQTWNFQCWHRDANPSVTSNFTNAVSLAFQ